MIRPVLVPGLGLDTRSSARLRAELPADVVLLPGMGLPGPVPSVDRLAALLRDRLGAGPVLLVGHSQGCQVAAAAAGDPRVAGVVLLGPTTDPRLRSARRLVLRWLATAIGEPWWQLPLVAVQWLSTGPSAMRRLWRSASPDPIDVRLGAVAVPVTVVRGTRDRLCPHDWAAAVAAAAPHGRLVELPGAAHMAVQTHPREVARVLRQARSASAAHRDRRA
ncbi:Alpha/beta hydrolase family protein [Geodermatophilus pulveris]|uniref:Alpha/beta hydrolase family protein n=1 Tax=Geodermatophilus pulveris TaxID=1564159 RepID=A0A239IB50_9ACTN|nr:Alpha/beta hydrolase family protein [Geodermatophilus pulveris]